MSSCVPEQISKKSILLPENAFFLIFDFFWIFDFSGVEAEKNRKSKKIENLTSVADVI